MLMRQNWATGSCSPRSRPWLTETKPPPIITWPGSSPAIPLRRKALCNERFRPCWLAGRSGRRSSAKCLGPRRNPNGGFPGRSSRRRLCEGGTADSAVVDELNTERVRATLNARYCEELHTIAQAGYERIFELMGPHDVGTSRTEILDRMSATVDEINALTQRLIDEYRPGDSVYDFLFARTLHTTVPRY